MDVKGRVRRCWAACLVMPSTAAIAVQVAWCCRALMTAQLSCSVLNSRVPADRHRQGHFPTGQAPLRTLYLVTRSLDPKGTGQDDEPTRWKPVRCSQRRGRGLVIFPGARSARAGDCKGR